MLKRFLSDKRGNVTITATLMLVPLMICAGAALDYSRLVRDHSQAQGAVDAAILAMANTNPLGRDTGELETEIDNFLQANLPEFNYNQITNVSVTKDLNSGALQVNVDATFPTTLTKLAGYNTFEYGMNAEIKIAANEVKYEIALVLDTTGSMAGSKMSTLKTVSKDFMQDLLDMVEDDGDVKFSIVPFSQYVNVGEDYSYGSWLQLPTRNRDKRRWDGCVGSRSTPLNVQDSSFSSNKVPFVVRGNGWWSRMACPSRLTPLTHNWGTLNSAINQLNAYGGTYIPAGVTWGLRTLSNAEPFTQGIPYSDMEDEGLKKVMIVMTDGDNTLYKPSWTHEHEGTWYSSVPNATTLAACSEAKNSNIIVYTISFGNLSSSTEQMLEDCATSSSHYYEAANSAGLASAFQAIAGGLSSLYLSK